MKPHSATIYTDTDHIFLEIPPPEGCTVIQTIELPNSPEGMEKVLQILNFRQQTSQRKIATKGAPTKWNLRQEAAEAAKGFKPKVARPKDTFKPELRLSAREILRQMRLI